MATLEQIEANRLNAAKSTGPRTEEGKAASSRNNHRHGLAGGQLIVPGECLEDFEQLRDELFEEHQPATPTEKLLVVQMAQYYWFSKRALRIQSDILSYEQEYAEKKLPVYIRYQTTNDRAFHKCLDTLGKLRKERIGFESQKRKEALQELEQARLQELHEVKMRTANHQSESARRRSADKTAPEPHRGRPADVETTVSDAAYTALFPKSPLDNHHNL